MIAIYRVTNRVNGKRYVGQTTRTLERRFKLHARTSKVHSMAIARAIQKYGAENFTIEPLQECAAQGEADLAERDWIARLGTRTPDGYNIRGGGRSGGSMSPESRAKQAAKMRGRRLTDKHKTAIRAGVLRTGYRHSRGVVERTAQKLRGRKVSEQARANMRRAFKGRQISLGCREKLRQSMRGRKMREETCLKNRWENNPNAKLTLAEALSIRALYATGNVSQEALAVRFRVKQTAVSRITRNVRWVGA